MKESIFSEIGYDIRNFLADIRYLTLFPKHYDVPKGLGEQYWRDVMRRYGNAEKAIQCSGYRWHIIEFKDGHKELAYLRVLKNGLFSGMSPAIYRGLFPRIIRFTQFDNIEKIRLAF